MKTVNKSVLIWYSPAEMYALVTQVDKYPEFLPWCDHAQVLATDADDTLEARLAARPQHLARLQQLQDENRLILAGPNPLPDNDSAFSGSLIVADFASLDEAEAWAQQDPYVDAGVYAEILIRPFKKVLPA